MLASCYLIIQYILFGVLHKKNEVYHYWAYIGIMGFFTVPLPFMVGFNGPRRFQWLYQPFVLLATWSPGYLQSIEMVGWTAAERLEKPADISTAADSSMARSRRKTRAATACSCTCLGCCLASQPSQSSAYGANVYSAS